MDFLSTLILAFATYLFKCDERAEVLGVTKKGAAVVVRFTYAIAAEERATESPRLTIERAVRGLLDRGGLAGTKVQFQGLREDGWRGVWAVTVG